MASKEQRPSDDKATAKQQAPQSTGPETILIRQQPGGAPISRKPNLLPKPVNSRWGTVALLVIILVLGLGMALRVVTATSGNIYYVATNGSDANLGTKNQPWRTIQKAANTMVAGDTVIVLGGEFDERVQVTQSGNSGTPITYSAEGTATLKGFTVEADYITLKGFDITDTDNDATDGWGIFVQGSNCVIEDNYIHFATRGGILLFANDGDDAGTSHCLVKNNRLYRNAMTGIEVQGRNTLIEGNEIWGTIQYHPQWIDPPDWVDADGIRFFGTGHIITKNYIHDITYDDPENIDPHIDCFQTWGSAHNIIFERNICEAIESQAPDEIGHAFMLADASNLIIRNNLLHAATFVNTGEGGNSDLTIVNNIMTSDLTLPLENHPEGVSLYNCPNTTVKNNIFYDLPASIITVEGATGQASDIGYNLAYRSDGHPLWGSPYPNDLWGVNPRFVNPETNDFHLQPASPAIDAGYDMGWLVSEDYDGKIRPQGSGYDIGAYEQAGNILTPNEFIIDNMDPRFSTSFAQDVWQVYIEIGGQHYGDSHYYNHLMGTGEDIAVWTFNLPRPGNYGVYVWWYEYDWRPTNVPYTVHHLDDSTTVRMNQQINGGQWNLLGAFDFQDQGSVVLSDNAASGQDIVADAIKLVYISPYSVYVPVVMK